jgi:hypothetical protein
MPTSWWSTPVIPVLGRQRQEDPEFKVSLNYIVRPCINKQKDANINTAIDYLLYKHVTITGQQRNFPCLIELLQTLEIDRRQSSVFLVISTTQI